MKGTYVLAFDLVRASSSDYPKVWKALERRFGFKRETARIRLPATTALARLRMSDRWMHCETES